MVGWTWFDDLQLVDPSSTLERLTCPGMMFCMKIVVVVHISGLQCLLNYMCRRMRAGFALAMA